MARLTRWMGLCGAASLALALATSTMAQMESSSSSAPPVLADEEDPAAALAQVEASLSLSAERVAQLKAEIEAMRGDRDKQNAALIAAGERVRLAEADVAAVEQKIGDLIVTELDTRGRLDGADGSISNVLAALERISRNPPPALIVDPSDALGSARSAILISAILPQLRAKADAVMADLKKLDEVKAAAEEEEGRLRANFEILEEEQLRIATLIAAQKQNETVASIDLAGEEKSAAELTERAAALKAQIDALAKRAQAVQTAAEATQRANNGGTPRLDQETVRLALANTERTEPAVPFLSAKGFLAFPAGGVPVVNYGDSDGFGGISKGISVVTRPEADVTAPADGWVAYAGTYLNYGQIVILDTGQNYNVLLAGLAKISVKTGQFVLMGAPIGTMGSRTIGRTVLTSAGAQNPTLYIELRKDSLPIDPTGWWAQDTVQDTAQDAVTAANTTQSG